MRSRFSRNSLSMVYPRCVRSACSASSCCTASVRCCISSASDVELRIKFRAFLLDGGELAGQHQAQFGAHFFAQARVALGFGGLALEGIHLPRDFVEDVVDTGQVELGVFQARFGQTLLGLEFRDPGGLFEDGAAVRRTAAEDLPNASLFDQRVGFRPEARAHEQFLNVAQAAEFAVQQIFAVAGAEQAARDHDFAVRGIAAG